MRGNNPLVFVVSLAFAALGSVHAAEVPRAGVSLLARGSRRHHAAGHRSRRHRVATVAQEDQMRALKAQQPAPVVQTAFLVVQQHWEEPYNPTDMNLADALQLVPTAVSDSFSSYLSSPSSSGADEVLKELNDVYRHAFNEKDALGLSCLDKKESMMKDVTRARQALTDVERQIAHLDQTATSLDEGVERALAEIESLRVHYWAERDTCAKNRKKMQENVKLLSSDLAQVQKLVQDTTTGCNSGGGTPPEITECSLPDGSYLTTFRESALQSRIANMSSIVERLVTLHLDYSIKGSAPAAASFLEVARRTHHRRVDSRLRRHKLIRRRRGNAKNTRKRYWTRTYSRGSRLYRVSKVHGHNNGRRLLVRTRHGAAQRQVHGLNSRHHLLVRKRRVAAKRQVQRRHNAAKRVTARKTSALNLRSGSVDGDKAHGQTNAHHLLATQHEEQADSQAQGLPSEWCAAARPPHCSAFADSMNTLQGNVRDLINDLEAEGDQQVRHCEDTLKAYDIKVKALKVESADASTTLASTMAHKSELGSLRAERVREVDDAEHDLDQEVDRCVNQLGDVNTTLCSVKRLYTELQTSSGGVSGIFAGDYLMSDWRRGSCSKTCEGGVMNLTRDVLRGPSDHSRAPPLHIMRSCNEDPCPVNAIMGMWQDWSVCTRACGGGTRTRYRKVMKQAANGGWPPRSTVHDQSCNKQPCDQDCFLAEWTTWSNCSKACNGGHQVRVKKVFRPALGEGSCPAPDSDERREVTKCAEQLCQETNPPLACASNVDVLLVLDSSGSVSSQGFDHVKTFAEEVAQRIVETPTGATAGAQVGVLTFADGTTVVQELTAQTSALKNSISGLQWDRTATNMGEALTTAADKIQFTARENVPKFVVVVTDGMPESAYIVGQEARRLRELKTRLMFVIVGDTMSEIALRRWSSWPYRENVVKVDDWASLNSLKATELVANICPVLT